MFNVAPMTTHRDCIVANCSILYTDSALTTRYSSASGDTALGFVGATADAYIVVNAGNTNYVRREDVLDIVANDRTSSERRRVEWAQGHECPRAGPAPWCSVLAMRWGEPHGGRPRRAKKGGGG